jgi:metal-dependent amidase/aminoacylase/carboxypeptidase family protein
MREFETTKRIKNALLEFGVDENAIKLYDPTGLHVDLEGTGKPQGKDYCVAFRADIDALSMTEENPHLEYSSKNKEAAHMCGHDGHTACLLGFVPLFFEKR